MGKGCLEIDYYVLLTMKLAAEFLRCSSILSRFIFTTQQHFGKGLLWMKAGKNTPG
jgi:hypothetical protein